MKWPYSWILSVRLSYYDRDASWHRGGAHVHARTVIMKINEMVFMTWLGYAVKTQVLALLMKFMSTIHSYVHELMTMRVHDDNAGPRLRLHICVYEWLIILWGLAAFNHRHICHHENLWPLLVYLGTDTLISGRWRSELINSKMRPFCLFISLPGRRHRKFMTCAHCLWFDLPH